MRYASKFWRNGHEQRVKFETMHYRDAKTNNYCCPKFWSFKMNCFTKTLHNAQIKFLTNSLDGWKEFKVHHTTKILKKNVFTIPFAHSK